MSAIYVAALIRSGLSYDVVTGLAHWLLLVLAILVIAQKSGAVGRATPAVNSRCNHPPISFAVNIQMAGAARRTVLVIQVTAQKAVAVGRMEGG